MYKAKLKVSFDSECSSFDDEILPEEHYTFEIPTEDITSNQLFKFFGTIARTMGYSDFNIMRGAATLAFNDMRSEDDMRKVAEEFDLKLAEDHWDIVKDLQKEILDLKAKLSRLENPDNLNYTDEEMDAMSAWNGLVPGSPAAIEKNCKCPILDNQEMPEDRKWVNGDCPLHGKVK